MGWGLQEIGWHRPPTSENSLVGPSGKELMCLLVLTRAQRSRAIALVRKFTAFATSPTSHYLPGCHCLTAAAAPTITPTTNVTILYDNFPPPPLLTRSQRLSSRQCDPARKSSVVGAGLLNALDSDFGVVISGLERPVDPAHCILQLMCLPRGVIVRAMARADLHFVQIVWRHDRVLSNTCCVGRR